MAAAVDVCAAVVRRGDHVLLATRPAGSHLSGRWEFPGGKVCEGESLEDCIRRELAEELGLGVLSAAPIASIRHRYPGKDIVLHFMDCTIEAPARPVCHEGQEIQWARVADLGHIDLAPADRAFADRAGHWLK